MACVSLTSRFWIGLLGGIVLLTGCATDRDSTPTRTSDAGVLNTTYPGWAPTSMQTMRQELVEAQQQVNDTLNTMFQLTNASAADLPSTYEAFSRQVAQVADQAEAARRRAVEMRTQRGPYITSWQKELERLSAPGSKAGAPSLKEAYSRLSDTADATVRAYQTFLGYAEDARKVLALELTPAGVKAAQSPLESARDSGITLREQIGNFIDQIDLLLPPAPPGT